MAKKKNENSLIVRYAGLSFDWFELSAHEKEKIRKQSPQTYKMIMRAVMKDEGVKELDVSEYETTTGLAPTGKFMELHPMIRKVDDRGLYRGPNPLKFMDVLQEMGIVKIINLQEGFWELINLKPYDLDRQANARYISVIHEPLSNFGFAEDEQIERIIGEIRKFLDQKQPVYICCRRGKDRTGKVAAAWRILEQDWTRDRAIEEWKRLGHSRFYRLLSWEKKFDQMMLRLLKKGEK